MPLITWKDDFSVGVASIDDQHKKLIDMINRAEKSAMDSNDADELSDLIMDMNAYARSHFAHENQLMETHGYPDAAGHMAMHDAFAKRAMPFQDSGLDNDALDPVAIFKYLAQWLNKHILETDMELGRFLNERGVR